MKKIFLVVSLLFSINSFADQDGWRGGGYDRGYGNGSGQYREYRDGGGHGWNQGYREHGRRDWDDRPRGYGYGYRPHHRHFPVFNNYGAYPSGNCRFNSYNGATFCPPPRYVIPPQFNVVVPLPRW